MVVRLGKIQVKYLPSSLPKGQKLPVPSEFLTLISQPISLLSGWLGGRLEGHWEFSARCHGGAKGLREGQPAG